MMHRHVLNKLNIAAYAYVKRIEAWTLLSRINEFACGPFPVHKARTSGLFRNSEHNFESIKSRTRMTASFARINTDANYRILNVVNHKWSGKEATLNTTQNNIDMLSPRTTQNGCCFVVVGEICHSPQRFPVIGIGNGQSRFSKDTFPSCLRSIAILHLFRAPP